MYVDNDHLLAVAWCVTLKSPDFLFMLFSTITKILVITNNYSCRYFRFFGRISESVDSHEDLTLKAIEANAAGLVKISGERIWSEWKKILEGNFGGELTLKMIHVRLSKYIGLPENTNTEEFEKVYRLSQKNGIKLQPMTLIAALLNTEEEMLDLHSRLKLSGQERDLALFVIANRNTENMVVDKQVDKSDFWLWECKMVDDRFARNKVIETLKYRGELKGADYIESWEIPTFPVTGHDLVEAKCPKGKLMGITLRQLKQLWKDSNFKMDRDELLNNIAKVMDSIDLKDHQEVAPVGKKKRKKF